MIKETVERLNDLSEEAFDLIDALFPPVCRNEKTVIDLLAAEAFGMPKKPAEYVAKKTAAHFQRVRDNLQVVAVIPAVIALNLNAAFHMICS